MSSFTFAKVLMFRLLEVTVQKGDRPGGRKGARARAELCVTGPAFQRAWPAGFVVAMFKGRKVDKIRLQTARPHPPPPLTAHSVTRGGQAGQAWVLLLAAVRGTSLSWESLVNE